MPHHGIVRAAPIAVTVLAVCTISLGLMFGSRAAGGADSFGYVSQAYLWLQGDLQVEDAMIRAVPWPHAGLTLTPLAYRIGPDGHSIVPTYAPGMPLLMAAARIVIGTCGPFLLAPLFAGLLVVGTYVLAARLTGDRVAGVVSALLMAGSPAFLFNLMWPMSDIATAALWTWSMALLAPRAAMPPAHPAAPDARHPTATPSSRTLDAAFAGSLAAAAIVVRPNLVPLAIVGATATVLWPPPRVDQPRHARRLVLYSLPVLAGALVVATVNNRLYGSPLRSGYGGMSTLYALAHLDDNLANYVPALLRSEGWLIVLAPLVLAIGGARSHRLRPGTAMVAAAFITVVWGSYLFYIPFAEWWYLRFLLPAFPWMFVLLSASLVWLAGRLGRSASAAGLVLVMVALTVYRAGFAIEHQVFTVGRDEHRYIAVADYIDRALPANAVFLTMQHSGTVRFYAGRHTIRYEAFSAARLPSVFDWLRDRGLRPYILLETWEEAQFRSLFRDAGAAGNLQVPIVAEMVEPVRIRIYDPLPAAGPAPPPDPIPWPRTRRCVEPQGSWATPPAR